jgi:hypothetical protein
MDKDDCLASILPNNVSPPSLKTLLNIFLFFVQNSLLVAQFTHTPVQLTTVHHNILPSERD